MENPRDHFQQLIDGLKKVAVIKGYVITDEEIAGKLGISKEDLHAYMNGERAMPGGMMDALRSAYGVESRRIQHITYQTVYSPDDEDDDDMDQK